MLSLLIFSLLAGASYCQMPGGGPGPSSSEYSDCATEQTFVDSCFSKHMDSLTLSGNEVTVLKRVSDLKDPTALLDKIRLDNMCNDTMHLKMYFRCVFANLTTCLRDVNSSQAHRLPDADTITNGVVNMCNSRDDLNRTCILGNKMKVMKCFTASAAFTKKEDTCGLQEALVTCIDVEMSPCDGRDVVRDYAISARPHNCEDTSAAMRAVSTLSLLLVTLLLSVLPNNL